MESLEVQVRLTADPQLLAKMFWNLSSEEQAQFFNHLAAEIQQTYEDPNNQWAASCGPEGEGQWYHLARDLEPQEITDIYEKGRGVLMAMAAPHYLNVLRYQTIKSQQYMEVVEENTILHKLVHP